MTNITDQLPYELCDGVEARIKGFFISEHHDDWLSRLMLIGGWKDRKIFDGWLFPWWQVKQVFEYKPGVPWVRFHETDINVAIEGKQYIFDNWDSEHALHRLSAFFCNDAYAFRVLYQCIKEFGDARD